jgi:4-amino-4-deoxy-L-arabinose transferase-like glycosyltransferase
LGTPYFAALAQINTLDMGVTAFTTITLCALLLAWHTARDGIPRQSWLIVAWAAAALAVLSKGLIGLVFPVATVVLYAVVQRQWRMPFRCLSWRGIGVFLLITTPWFLQVSLANPEFAWFFFVHEHFLRFLTPVSRREAPVWYFLPVIAAGLIPWTLLALPAVRDVFARPATSGFQPLRFTAIWAAFIVLFFSASSSKLPAYVLPAFPAFAILIAVAAVRRTPQQVAAWIAPMGLVGVIGIIASLSLADRRRVDPFTQALYHAFEPYLTVMVSVLTLTVVVTVWILVRQRLRWQAMVLGALGTLAAVQIGIRGYEVLSPLQSAHRLAAAAKPHMSAATVLFAVDTYDQTLPFYLDRTFILVDYVDEFELGIRAQPERALPDVAAFVERWGKASDAIAIMQPGQFEKLSAQGLPMTVIIRDPRRVLVRKPQ